MRKATTPSVDLGLVYVKHEGQEEPENEFIEVEEEPNSEPREEWEKDIPPFLRKLSTMVNENRVIWRPDGSLIVKDPDHLSSYLLPTYFQSIKACSFVRQLNMYGFHKVDDPTGQNPKHYEFRHPHFVPGHKELLRRIERRKTSKRSTKADEDSNRAKGNKPTPTPSLANQSILEAVTKLQQQTQDNQQALMQVLSELKSYRQSHADLERKLNQYVAHYSAVSIPAPVPQSIDNNPPVPRRPIATVNRNRNTNASVNGNGMPVQVANNNMPLNNSGNMNGMPNGNYNATPTPNPSLNLVGANGMQRQNNIPPQPNYAYQQQSNFKPASTGPTGIEVYASAPQQTYIPTYNNNGEETYIKQDPVGYVDAIESPQNNHHVNTYSPIQQQNGYSHQQQQHTNYLPHPQNTYSPEDSSPPTYSPHSDSSPSPSSSTPSPYVNEYHAPSPSDPSESAPIAAPPFHYANFEAASEQIDEFVLLNLGLEDGHFSEYINNGLGNSNPQHHAPSNFSYNNNSTFDPTLTAN